MGQQMSETHTLGGSLAGGSEESDIPASKLRGSHPNNMYLLFACLFIIFPVLGNKSESS